MKQWFILLAVLQGAGIFATEISPALRENLVFMFEEEKLARDIYTALNAHWNQRVFENISRSEQTHMDRIAALWNAYGISNPAASLPHGQFRNPELQALYNTLLTRGRSSLEEAYRVGANIERLDIADLQKALAGNLPADVKTAYEDLLRGSENHLRAFTQDRQGNGNGQGRGRS